MCTSDFLAWPDIVDFILINCVYLFFLYWSIVCCLCLLNLLTLRPDVDDFFSLEVFEKFSFTSLADKWILCSEWVPSEWEYKRLIKHHINPQFTSITILWNEKLFVRNKSINISRTSNHSFRLKYQSIIHNNTSSSEKVPCCPPTSKSTDIFI